MRKLRVCSAVTALLMLAGLAAGCKPQTAAPGSSDGAAKAVDMGGYEMVIATLWEWNVLPEQGVSEIGDKIRARYDQVQKDYHCTITFRATNPETITEDIATAVAAGDKYADFIHLDAPRLHLLRTKKIARSLNDIQGFDTSLPIFNETITETFTDKEGVYGVYCGRSPAFGSYLVANTALLKRLGVENPQKYVASREWTFDRFRQYLIDCTRDTDGDGKVDVWGLATGDWAGNDFEKPMIWANGGSVLKKNEAGKLVFALSDTKAQTALNYLNDIMFVRKLWKDKGTADYLDGNVAFLANNVLTETHLIHQEDDFTVLPMPIGPDATEYTSLASITAWGATTANKPEDMEKAAVIFSAFNAPLNGSVEKDHEEWYDYYRRGYLRDDESVDVFKILTKNLYVDVSMGVGEITNIVGNSIYSCTHSNEKTPKAAMDSIAPEIQAMADEGFAQS